MRDCDIEMHTAGEQSERHRLILDALASPRELVKAVLGDQRADARHVEAAGAAEVGRVEFELRVGLERVVDRARNRAWRCVRVFQTVGSIRMLEKSFIETKRARWAGWLGRRLWR